MLPPLHLRWPLANDVRDVACVKTDVGCHLPCRVWACVKCSGFLLFSVTNDLFDMHMRAESGHIRETRRHGRRHCWAPERIKKSRNIPAEMKAHFCCRLMLQLTLQRQKGVRHQSFREHLSASEVVFHEEALYELYVYLYLHHFLSNASPVTIRNRVPSSIFSINVHIMLNVDWRVFLRGWNGDGKIFFAVVDGDGC